MCDAMRRWRFAAGWCLVASVLAGCSTPRNATVSRNPYEWGVIPLDSQEGIDRFVGRKVLDEEGMNSYFLPNNCGKEAITLNLAAEEGRALLRELITKLDVDVFACNQRPRSYGKLGIDYETLSGVKPDLIWLGITGSLIRNGVRSPTWRFQAPNP